MHADDRAYWDVALPAAPAGGPPAWVRAAVEQVGDVQLAQWGVRLLTGQAQPGDAGDPDIALIRGEADALDPGLALDPHLSRWLGARVLLHHWHPRAAAAVIGGLGDGSAAVRALCCRIVAARGAAEPGAGDLGGAAGTVESLLDDPDPRVRSAAARALGEVGGVGSAASLEGLMMDPDTVLAGAAEEALERLAERHQRPDLRPEPEY